MCVGLFLGSLFCPIDLHACIYHAVLSFVGWLYILKQEVSLICSCSKLLWLLGVFCGSIRILALIFLFLYKMSLEF